MILEKCARSDLRRFFVWCSTTLFFFFTNVHDCTWGKVEVFLTTHDLNPSFFVGYSEFPSIYIGLGGLIFWSFFLNCIPLDIRSLNFVELA